VWSDSDLAEREMDEGGTLMPTKQQILDEVIATLHAEYHADGIDKELTKLLLKALETEIPKEEKKGADLDAIQAVTLDP